MLRLLRFAVGSLLATLASAVVFPLVYQGAGGGPQLATLAAFVSGAAVSFIVNRSWTWNRRHRAGLSRDLAGFLVVAVSIALLAAVATSVADAYTGRLGIGATERT